MSERPPSLPPEEDFSFVRDAEAVEFEYRWTPAMQKRIRELLEELHWPILRIDEELPERLYAALRNEIIETSVLSKESAKNAQMSPEKLHERLIQLSVDEAVKTANIVLMGRMPGFSSTRPTAIGPMLIRLKNSLGR